MVAIPLSFGCKCASCAGIWISSTGTTIGSPTPTTSPASARTCASTHFSRITSSALIFFDAATPSLHLSLWSPKICPTSAALASHAFFPRNQTPLPRLSRLCPSRTPAPTPTRHPTPPSSPSSRQDHSTLLIGLLLSALSNIPASHDSGISDACTIRTSHSLQNRSPTLIGLYTGSTMGILYLQFDPSAFHSTLHFQPTPLSMDAPSSQNSLQPHLLSFLGHLHSFITCGRPASLRFSRAT